MWVGYPLVPIEGVFMLDTCLTLTRKLSYHDEVASVNTLVAMAVRAMLDWKVDRESPTWPSRSLPSDLGVNLDLDMGFVLLLLFKVLDKIKHLYLKELKQKWGLTKSTATYLQVHFSALLESKI